MNNGHYSRDNYRQNQPQHQNLGYNSQQSQGGWREHRPQQQVGGMNRHGSSQPQQNLQHHDQQALPPGWVEATDPSSGKVYYCNPKTRETKWDRPTVSMTNPTVSAPQQPRNSMATEGNLSSHHKAPNTWQSQQQQQRQQQQQQQQQQPLPPGWVEAKDPNSGKVYYCNPQTRETSWERPASSRSAGLTTRLEIEGNTNSFRGSFTSIDNDAVDNADTGFDTNATRLNQSSSSSLIGKTTRANTIDNNKDKESHKVDDDRFDELQSLTTGQIAHLIRLHQHQQSAKQLAQSDEERQVQISTIISSRTSKDSTEKNSKSSQDPCNYVPIDLSLMSSLSSTERTEPGRLDVRMYALREELRKFGYSQTSTQPAHFH